MLSAWLRAACRLFAISQQLRMERTEEPFLIFPLYQIIYRSLLFLLNLNSFHIFHSHIASHAPVPRDHQASVLCSSSSSTGSIYRKQTPSIVYPILFISIIGRIHVSRQFRYRWDMAWLSNCQFVDSRSTLFRLIVLRNLKSFSLIGTKTRIWLN